MVISVSAQRPTTVTEAAMWSFFAQHWGFVLVNNILIFLNISGMLVCLRRASNLTRLKLEDLVDRTTRVWPWWLAAFASFPIMWLVFSGINWLPGMTVAHDARFLSWNGSWLSIALSAVSGGSAAAFSPWFTRQLFFRRDLNLVARFAARQILHPSDPS